MADDGVCGGCLLDSSQFKFWCVGFMKTRVSEFLEDDV